MTENIALRKWHAEQVERLNPEIRDRAVAMLRTELAPILEEIRAMAQASPTWCTPMHFSWGQGVRNLLRQRGFGEQELGVLNVDDVYVGLVELAIGIKGED